MNEQHPELASIREAVALYTEGVHTGDMDMLKMAFHPRAMMYGASGPNITITGIQGLYDYLAAHEAPSKTGEPHACTISSIRHAGDAAMVEVDERSLVGHDYTNYLQLLKIEGKWVILCKSFNSTPSVK